MEELQDAIEDAQYVNAIATQDDIRPVLPWETPSDEQLESWKRKIIETPRADKVDPVPLSFEWVVGQEIGFFLFSAFVKETKNDFIRMNFCEDICRFRRLAGRHCIRKAKSIVRDFVMPAEKDQDSASSSRPPAKTEIEEFDLMRSSSTMSVLTQSDLEAAISRGMDHPSCSETRVGLRGSMREKLIGRVNALESHNRSRSKVDTQIQESPGGVESARDESDEADAYLSAPGYEPLDHDLFAEAECVVYESLKRDYWEAFLASSYFKKLQDFLWYRDRPVVPGDFFVMRVLGRGGFGLVTGE